MFIQVTFLHDIQYAIIFDLKMKCIIHKLCIKQELKQ